MYIPGKRCLTAPSLHAVSFIDHLPARDGKVSHPKNEMTPGQKTTPIQKKLLAYKLGNNRCVKDEPVKKNTKRRVCCSDIWGQQSPLRRRCQQTTLPLFLVGMLTVIN